MRVQAERPALGADEVFGLTGAGRMSVLHQPVNGDRSASLETKRTADQDRAAMSGGFDSIGCEPNLFR
jgi:hypothetical protein